MAGDGASVAVPTVIPTDSDSAHNAPATTRGSLSQSRFSFIKLVFPVSRLKLISAHARANAARQHHCAFLASPAGAEMRGISATGLLI
jgi:hypothetical protein